MAGPEAVADIQRRAAENPEVAFKAFNTYPWQADQLFNVSNTYQMPRPPSTSSSLLVVTEIL
jgi:hypothetical protein